MRFAKLDVREHRARICVDHPKPMSGKYGEAVDRRRKSNLANRACRCAHVERTRQPAVRVPDTNRAIKSGAGNKRPVVAECKPDYSAPVSKKTQFITRCGQLLRTGTHLQNVHVARAVTDCQVAAAGGNRGHGIARLTPQPMAWRSIRDQAVICRGRRRPELDATGTVPGDDELFVTTERKHVDRTLRFAGSDRRAGHCTVAASVDLESLPCASRQDF